MITNPIQDEPIERDVPADVGMPTPRKQSFALVKGFFLVAVILVAGGVVALSQTALRQSQETRSDASQGSTTTLTVCASGTAGQNGCQYIGGEGIQQAVDAAKDGDTVLIKNGTYTNVELQIGENNHPAKQHLKIQGESRHTTILDGQNNGDVIHIGGDSIVAIENLTIENAGLSSVVMSESQS